MADRSRSTRAGRAAVELFADDSQLIRGLRQAERRIRQFGQRVAAIGRQIAAVGAAGSAAFAGAAVIFARTGDSLDKLSTRTGISVEALSELRFAADRTGTSLAEVGEAVLRANRRLGRITAGQASATQVSALEQLGLDAERLRTLNPEQTLLALADAIAGYGDQAEAAGLAQRAFGTGIDRILPLLLEGADGIEELRAQARDLGLRVFPEDSKAAAALSDAFGSLVDITKDIAFEVGAALGPALTGVLDVITPLVTNVNEWARANRPLVAGIAAITAGVAVLGSALFAAGLAIQVAAFAAGGLATALAAITSPIALVVTGVAAAGAAILTFTDTGSAALAFLQDSFRDLGDRVGEIVGGIRDALAAGDIRLAADVLWAGLKVAWAEGTGALERQWVTFTQNFLQVALEAFSRVSGFAIDSLANVRLAFADLGQFLGTFWADVANRAESAWALVVNQAKKAGNEIRGVVDEDFDVAGANRQANEQLASTIRGANARQREAEASADRANREDRERIEQTRRRQQSALDQFISETFKGSIQAIDQATKQAEAEAAKAQAELDARINEASSAATDAEAGRAPGRQSRDFNLDDLLDQIQGGVSTATGIQSRGGFDARSLALASGVDRDQRETAENTRELVRLFRTASQRRTPLVFGP